MHLVSPRYLEQGAQAEKVSERTGSRKGRGVSEPLLGTERSGAVELTGGCLGWPKAKRGEGWRLV